MPVRIPRLAATIAVLLAAAVPAPAPALDAAVALRIAAGTSAERREAIAEAVASPDERLVEYLRALGAGEVRIAGERVLRVDTDGRARDVVTGQGVALPAEAEEAVLNNRMRREIAAAVAGLNLLSPDRATRLAAASQSVRDPDPARLPLLRAAEARERDPDVKALLARARASVEVRADDRATRLAAARALGDSGQPATKTLLLDRLAEGGESDPEVRAALATSLAGLEQRLAVGEFAGLVFAGVSLGSVLLLAALGLAITYGLMGVINMAHGELMMVGAYATYVTQQAFRQWLPEVFGAYLIAAVPAAFLSAALVGAVLERGVIRFLYGRPLETLLATWGISLMLAQGVRSLFGAQNVAVENPSWLSGGLQLLPNLVLPYNRVAIIVFSLLVLGAIWAVLTRTRIGLFVRAATQNRTMARCVGVPTSRVDTLAFSLGAGVAGLAGCALSQIGNVGPDLGQQYIVDSFLVVVLGGVGQLAGSVYAGLGLGVVNKLLEGVSGAVIAKIVLLVLVILFIQKRPQGIFALKGRSAEA